MSSNFLAYEGKKSCTFTKAGLKLILWPVDFVILSEFRKKKKSFAARKEARRVSNLEKWAEHLGMSIEYDRNYFDIVEEYLLEILPDGWLKFNTVDGPYYSNKSIGMYSWDNPNDDKYRFRFNKRKYGYGCKKLNEKSNLNVYYAGDLLESINGL